MRAFIQSVFASLWKMAALAAVAPLAAAGLFVAATLALNVDRFDPAHFTPEIVADYADPGDVAGDLAVALEANDTATLAKLQGLRRPSAFPAGGKLTIAMLRRMDKSTYFKALIADDLNAKLYVYRIGPARGRWVVAPEDAYYYLDSGLWAATWLPFALGWWTITASALIVTAASRALRRWRDKRIHAPHAR